MIGFVRFWHDHCMKRMPCPWTVQFVLPKTGRLEQIECAYFDLEYAARGVSSVAVVTGLIDPPTLQAENVASIVFKRTKDAAPERIDG